MSKRKYTATGQVPNTQPINVALPNTTEKKMTAIADLAKATLELSKALTSVNTNVRVEGNIVSHADIGIKVATEGS